ARALTLGGNIRLRIRIPRQDLALVRERLTEVDRVRAGIVDETVERNRVTRKIESSRKAHNVRPASRRNNNRPNKRVGDISQLSRRRLHEETGARRNRSVSRP